MEQAILVGLKQKSQNSTNFESSLEELKRLTQTAGAKPVAVLTQELDKPKSATYIGKGKVNEVKTAAELHQADIIIFNDQLSPMQERNLNDQLGLKVIDRTALILDIFASHAHSKEGKIQVELAQYNYLLTRLSGRGIALSRLGGGIGTRGPGETKLEADRRRIRQRVQHLKKLLHKVDKQRQTQRKKRRQVPRVSLVGYTNSGKSALLNTLTKAKVEVADKLFSTLDSTTRRLYIEGNNFTITDTVGFIEKLPTTLIEAFKSTLNEVQEADVILHIVDSASGDYENQIKAVNDILGELKVEGPQMLVFNKIDLLDKSKLATIKNRYTGVIAISALYELGLVKLKKAIVKIYQSVSESLSKSQTI